MAGITETMFQRGILLLDSLRISKTPLPISSLFHRGIVGHAQTLPLSKVRLGRFGVIIALKNNTILRLIL